MKIVIFETADWERHACLRLAGQGDFHCTQEPLNATTVARYADAEIVSTFINSQATASVLAQLPRLQYIATRSTGYDHIDTAYCRDRVVAVSNVPYYGSSTVAEHVFALLLALSRKLDAAVAQTRRGIFDRGDLRGFELEGRTMGVVGAGQIGRRVLKIASGFGMTTIAYDERPDRTAAEELGFSYTDLPDLLRAADVVSLHVPGHAQNVGLIGADQFSLMKPGAVLINTARGNLVDLAALLDVLQTGRLRAAGLDVLPEESLLRDEAEVFRSPNVTPKALRSLVGIHALQRLPNVLITPHVAYNTDEALGRIIDTTVANIEAFLSGAVQNQVA